MYMDRFYKWAKYNAWVPHALVFFIFILKTRGTGPTPGTLGPLYHDFEIIHFVFFFLIKASYTTLHIWCSIYDYSFPVRNKLFTIDVPYLSLFLVISINEHFPVN